MDDLQNVRGFLFDDSGSISPLAVSSPPRQPLREMRGDGLIYEFPPLFDRHPTGRIGRAEISRLQDSLPATRQAAQARCGRAGRESETYGDNNSSGLQVHGLFAACLKRSTAVVIGSKPIL